MGLIVYRSVLFLSLDNDAWKNADVLSRLCSCFCLKAPSNFLFLMDEHFLRLLLFCFVILIVLSGFVLLVRCPFPRAAGSMVFVFCTTAAVEIVAFGLFSVNFRIFFQDREERDTVPFLSFTFSQTECQKVGRAREV